MRILTFAIPPIIALAVLIILLPHPSLAEDDSVRVEVWQDIQAGAAETVMAKLSATDLAARRAAFAAFQSGDAKVDAFSRDLLTDYANDARAMTARGFYLLNRGWAYRGAASRDKVWPEGAAKMKDLHTEAMGLAEAALKADPGLVPASDLFILLSRTTPGSRDIPTEFERIMAIAPNHQSLMLAADGYSPRWGGTTDFGMMACADWASKIPDVAGYTREICEIDVATTGSYPGAFDIPLAVLQQANSPVLDWARLIYARQHREDTEAVLAIYVEMHRKGDLNYQDYLTWDNLEGHMGFDPGPRITKALPALLASMKTDLDLQPEDGILLETYLRAAMQLAKMDGTVIDAAEFDRRFAQVLQLAPYDANMWFTYARYLESFSGPDGVSLAGVARAQKAWMNAVAYSNHNVEWIRFYFGQAKMTWDMMDRRNLDAFDATGTPAFARDDFNAVIVCPTIRVIRLLEAACENDPNGAASCDGQPRELNGDLRPEMIARAKRRNACALELTSDIADLAYTPVEVDFSRSETE